MALPDDKDNWIIKLEKARRCYRRGLCRLPEDKREHNREKAREYKRANRDDILMQRRIDYTNRIQGKPTSGALKWGNKWLELQGLAVGDLVELTNCAGRTFKGWIVDCGRALGHIRLCDKTNDYFCFAVADAQLTKIGGVMGQ